MGLVAAIVSVVTKIAQGALGKFLLTSALNVGIQALTAKKGEKQRAGRTQNVRSATYAHQVIYGTVRKGGMIFYLNGTGSNNTYLHMAVAVANHQCESIEDFYFDGERVQIDSTGNPTGTLRDFARLQWRLGEPDQLALPDMVSENSNWTENHRARGRCYFYARLKYSDQKFPSFIPAITATVKGHNDILDPRTGLRGWSDNPALCAADVLERYSLVPRERIHLESLIEAANICDELVQRADGTEEKRYRCGGFFELEGDPETWVEPFALAMAGHVGEHRGVYYIHAGAWREPFLTIRDEDVLGAISYRTAESDYSRPNAVKGTFVSSEVSHDQVTDFPALRDEAAIAAEGEVRWLEADLEFVPSHTQSQRVASIMLKQEREDESLAFISNLRRGLDVKPFDTVNVELESLGISGTFRVVDADVVIETEEESSSISAPLVLKRHTFSSYDWDPITDEKQMVEAVGAPIGPEPEKPSSVGFLFNGTIHQSNAEPPLATFDPGQVEVFWTDPSVPIEELEIEVEIEFYRSATFEGNLYVSLDYEVLQKTITVPLGQEQAIVNFADPSRDANGGWHFFITDVRYCRIRSKVNDTPTFSPWVNASSL